MITPEEQIDLYRDNTCGLLQALQVGIHRVGYRHLVILIPCYAMDAEQSLTKELYPYAAARFGYSAWQPVERAVRVAIQDAWARGDPAVWEKYFPGAKKPPSNKRFIATLAERLKKTPPDDGRG